MRWFVLWASLRADGSPSATLGGWRPEPNLAAFRASSSPGPSTVSVGGHPVQRQLGLASGGRPALSSDGAWAAWTYDDRLTVREVASGSTRTVVLREGTAIGRAAFFGAGKALALAVELEPPDREATSLVRYDLATLAPTHAVSTAEPNAFCSELLGSPTTLACVVNRLVDVGSHVLTIRAPWTVQTLGLEPHTDYSHAVLTPDGAHLYLSRQRDSAIAGGTITSLSLTSGAIATFAAPFTNKDFVDSLAVEPSGTHLAVGTFHSRVVLLALPGGSVVREAAPYPSERDFVALSDSRETWAYRGRGRLRGPETRPFRPNPVSAVHGPRSVRPPRSPRPAALTPWTRFRRRRSSGRDEHDRGGAGREHPGLRRRRSARRGTPSPASAVIPAEVIREVAQRPELVEAARDRVGGQVAVRPLPVLELYARANMGQLPQRSEAGGDDLGRRLTPRHPRPRAALDRRDPGSARPTASS